MVSQDPVEVGDTTPCVGCGMCCNGTLYWMARVTPGEEQRILDHGLQLLEQSKGTYFKLPCHHEKCGKCTIYETRFDICRSFRCRLLKSYQAGETTLEQANHHVKTALELLGAVVSDDPAAATYFERGPIRARLAEATSDETAEEKALRLRRLLNIIAFDDYLERWFRNPKPVDDQPDRSPSNS